MFLAHTHNCSNQEKLETELTITTIIPVTLVTKVKMVK